VKQVLRESRRGEVEVGGRSPPAGTEPWRVSRCRMSTVSGGPCACHARSQTKVITALLAVVRTRSCINCDRDEHLHTQNCAALFTACVCTGEENLGPRRKPPAAAGALMTQEGSSGGTPMKKAKFCGNPAVWCKGCRSLLPHTML
jgi:hypothetical protein